MYFLATSGQYVVFCGKQCIYVLKIRRSATPHLFVIHINRLTHRPRIKKSSTPRSSIENVDISRSALFICASDTERRVYVYERISNIRWDFQYFFELEKSIIKTMFDTRCTSIIVIDKAGDIWRGHMTTKAMATPVKLLSHNSIIHDVTITSDNSTAYMFDRDNNIMTSSFPESYTFDHYFVGHKTPVVGMALVEKETILLSVEAEGKLKLWSTSGSKQCIDTYDIYACCNGCTGTDSAREGEVCGVKVTEALGRIWIALKIFGSTQVSILKLKYLTREMCKISEVKIDSEFSEMVWNHQSLYVYSPESTCIVKKFDVTDHGLVSDDMFRIPDIADYKADLDGFAKANNTAYKASLQRLSSSNMVIPEEDSQYGSADSERTQDVNIEFADEEEFTVYEEAENEGVSTIGADC